MGFDNAMARIDEAVTDLVGSWNIYTTIITTALVGILTYSIATRREADLNPWLLARQAVASDVRQEGESPVYRKSTLYPLTTGLGIKDPGASKWSAGRDGDLRDIWRKTAFDGADGGPVVREGRILTVLGSENVIEHSIEDINRQINLIGDYISQQGGNRVAIYLPNSLEYMVALFACAFYNLTAVLLPYDQSDDAVISMLRRSAADTVITAPGSFPLDSIVKGYPALRQLVWVVDEGSKHMDWNEMPEGAGGSVNVATWQEIVHDAPQMAGTTLPPREGQKEPRDVTIFWKAKEGAVEELVRFTSANLIAGVAGELAAVPTADAFSPSDLFLPVDSLANTHTLSLLLAALYSHSSVAFNSVAGDAPDLILATRGIAPTIIAVPPKSLLSLHKETSGRLTSFFANKVHWLQTRSLVQDGVMPAASLISSYNDSQRPSLGAKPGKLRMVFTAERAGADTPLLPSAVLSDLRVFLGARVLYALTAPKVAGAVAQTHPFDYRVFEDKCSHFGSPLSSVEIMLRDKDQHKNTDEEQVGEIVVRGPCVAGHETSLGVVGRIRDDYTLSYV